MSFNESWNEEVFLTLKELHHEVEKVKIGPFDLIATRKNLIIHLIALDNKFTPQDGIELQQKFKNQGKFLVHLWEDVWHARKNQVISRFHSFLGSNNSIHGRKTKIQEIDIQQTKDFLNNYHLQAYVKAKYNFGLFTGSELIAVCSFSEARVLQSKGDSYQSAELVRFATRDKTTVVGGLSKLITHFLKLVKLDDIMTYADRDWSLGQGYEKLGFTFTKETTPLEFYSDQNTLKRYTENRLPKSVIEEFYNQDALMLDQFMDTKSYNKVFNTGNLKFHLYQ